jgi:hypothetical protein
MRALPGLRSEPAAHAAFGSPDAESTELSEHDSSSGHQHAGHLPNCDHRIRNEAQHRHGEHDVEGALLERQRLGSALRQRHMQTAFCRSRSGSFQHLLLGIDGRYKRPPRGRLERVVAIASSDVEQTPAVEWTHEVEDNFGLNAVRDRAERRCPPLCVRVRRDDGRLRHDVACNQAVAQ